MRVIARGTLRAFWEQHQDVAEPLKAWFHEVLPATWKNPADVKATYGSASLVV